MPTSTRFWPWKRTTRTGCARPSGGSTANAGVTVPPGFTISTAVCRWYYGKGETVPEGFEAQQQEALDRLEGLMSKRLGDPRDPLLVSVRSGAKFSMPGMMDTVLNLGLND